MASIATLVLFVMYFIGRIITLVIEKKVIFEKIDIYFDREEIPNNIKITDEYSCENNEEIVVITPHEKSYNWLVIYECRYDEKKNKLIKVKELEKFENIINDTSVIICATVTCGIPKYCIEFERSDFIKGTIPLQCNGKNSIEEEMISYRHTFKSFIYYLFR